MAATDLLVCFGLTLNKISIDAILRLNHTHSMESQPTLSGTAQL